MSRTVPPNNIRWMTQLMKITAVVESFCERTFLENVNLEYCVNNYKLHSVEWEEIPYNIVFCK